MRTLIATCLALIAVAAMAEEPKTAAPAEGTRIYQTDRYGNVQYHKPSLVVKENGRIQPVDPYGNTQFSKPGFQVQGNKVYATDKLGNRLEQTYAIQGDKVYETDKYGNTRGQAYAVKGDKVFATDKFGNTREQAYEVRTKTPPPSKK
jgi:predicted RNA-binding protein